MSIERSGDRSKAVDEAMAFSDEQKHGPPGFWNDLKLLTEEVRRLRFDLVDKDKLLTAAMEALEKSEELIESRLIHRPEPLGPDLGASITVDIIRDALSLLHCPDETGPGVADVVEVQTGMVMVSRKVDEAKEAVIRAVEAWASIRQTNKGDEWDKQVFKALDSLRAAKEAM